jgi:molybdate/tungstate transport system permease protein
MQPLHTRHNTFSLLMTFMGGLAMLFIAAPVFGILFKTGFPELKEALIDRNVTLSISRTLAISFAATLFFGLFSIPLAWIFSRRNFRGKRLLRGLVNIPIIIPHSAAGIALLSVLSSGRTSSGFAADLIGTPAGIALAMAFVSIPFLINAAIDGFSAVPERLEKAALNLGASPARVFFTISLPLAWRQILTGAIMMFGRGMSEFGAVIIIAYHPMTVPVLIYERFTSFGLAYARPVAVIFIVISLLVFVVLRLIPHPDKKQQQ